MQRKTPAYGGEAQLVLNNKNNAYLFIEIDATLNPTTFKLYSHYHKLGVVSVYITRKQKTITKLITSVMLSVHRLKYT